ncbi:MAG: TRAP transporter small permease subunit, partial [Rhodoplanes sp.]
MGALRTIWYRLEEGVIALLLAFMTILTFVQVVLRYGWGTGILWGQEAVLYTFAWLVLFGLAYGFRTRAHLGIN